MGFIPQTQVSNRWLTITKSYLSLIFPKKLSRFGDGKTILTRIISEVCVPGLLSYHVQTPQATMTSQAVSSWIGIRLLPLGRSIDDCSPAHEQVERGGSFRVVDDQFWNYEVILNDRLTQKCNISLFIKLSIWFCDSIHYKRSEKRLQVSLWQKQIISNKTSSGHSGKRWSN